MNKNLSLSIAEERELNNLFLNSITASDFAKAKKYMEEGADINAENSRIFYDLAMQDSVKELEYFLNKVDNKKISENVLDGAIISGSMDCLKCLVERKIGLDYHSVLDKATKYGRLEMIIYLLDKEFKFDGNAFFELENTVVNGHIHVLKYMVENKYINLKENSDDVLFLATLYAQIPILEYCSQQGISIKDNDIVLETLLSANNLQNNRVKMVQYLVLKQGISPITIKNKIKNLNIKSESVDKVIDWCNNYLKSIHLKENLENGLVKKESVLTKRIKL